MNKNAREKLFLETAYLSIYNPRLLAEKAVDGTLMCSKDCCGSPVMECKCGDDCPHCNCFMIQKAVKDYGLKSPLLEAKEDHVRLTKGSTFNVTNVNVPKEDKELIDHYMKKGFKEVKKPSEDNELDLSDLIAAEDAEDINKDEEKDVDVKEGGGTSADEFKEEEKTGYA